MEEILGMQAENKQREVMRESMAYIKDDFDIVISQYGIDHNSVIGYLMED